jgi:hypothetical protein
MIMLLLTSTLLLSNNNTNNADDVNDVDNVNNANDVNVDNVNDEKRKKSSIEKEEKSRLDTSLDRIERLVMCCFFALLIDSQTKFISEFALSKN